MIIPKIPARGRCLQSLINDPRVYSIDGPMCRWSLKAGGTKDKNRVHEETDKMAGSQVPKKLLKYFVEMVDGTVTGELFT